MIGFKYIGKKELKGDVEKLGREELLKQNEEFVNKYKKAAENSLRGI